MLLALVGCAPATRPGPLPEAPLAALRQAAEEARGLAFRGPVDARFLPEADLARTLRRDFDLDMPQALADRDASLKIRLGLLPAGTDLRAAALGFQSQAVVGYYTPLQRRLYVVGDPVPRLPAPVASVAVHELVHALQDSHSGLLDVLLGLTDHDDLAFAIGALLEGDATWAAFRWEESDRGVAPLSPEQLTREFGIEWATTEYPEAPRLLRETFLLQYPLGYALASGLADAGGVAALDAALVDPPLSSAELLHPEQYLDPRRRGPLVVLPVEDWLAGSGACAVVAANRFGELALRIWGREHGLELAASRELGRGWQADRAALLDCPEGRRVAWLVQFGDLASAQRFAEAAAPLAAGLVEPLRLDHSGRRVLLSAGLSPVSRRTLLESLDERRFPDLEAFLAAHPEVPARARALREASAALPGSR